MGQALYRKYRSTRLADIVGQDHITRALETAIKGGRISHAYLLTGPRGVGKTSIARILAHEINGLPYDDQSHLDIIEIDAASNNGVEDVRDLREKVYVAPAQSKYKVYIIDEVHMLSKAAFNALLKTLEEPPAHVVFILATTESHKLPDTIISRTQRFVFRPIEAAKAVAHLRTIADAEKITISDEALQQIAAHGDGSFRDSIGLLDQLASSGKTIELTDVLTTLGMPSQEAITSLAAAIVNGPVPVIMQQLTDLYDRGFQAAGIARELAQTLREQLIANQLSLPLSTTRQLLSALLEVPASRDPERYLEIVLLANFEQPANPVSLPAAAPIAAPASEPVPTPAVEKPSVKAKAPEPTVEKTEEKPKKADTKEAKPEPKTEKAPAPAISSNLDEASWQEVLNSLKKRYNTLYSVVRMAQPQFVAEGQLELRFAFAFHQKRLSEAKNRQIVADAIKQVTGQDVDIIGTLDPNLKLAKTKIGDSLPPIPDSAPADPVLSTISNIFGGGELLES